MTFTKYNFFPNFEAKVQWVRMPAGVVSGPTREACMRDEEHPPQCRPSIGQGPRVLSI